ncbi:OmpA family protein [Neolewinella aurantiaca]|nr:OmpA family protein [Neolewinella aurantiaca]
MLRPFLFSLLMAYGCALWAQNVELPDPAPFTTLGFKMVMLDHGIPNEQLKDLQKSYALELVPRRQFSKHFGMLMPLRIGNADIGEFRNVRFGTLDFLARIAPAGSENKVSPYLQGGYGFSFEQDARPFQAFPLAAGLDLKVGKDMWVTLQAEYRSTRRENRKNVNLSLGYVFRFGSPDRDGDRIADGQDKCPDLPGMSTADGCPDADRDGTPDSEDLCPDVQGDKSANGCPDYDKDGIPDDKDQCPYEAGKKRLRGCPDIDGDGVPDDIDNCPNTPGGLYTGCPDSDNDGFEDNEDDCPGIAGPNRGCPEVSPQLQALLERATNRITFEGRSATLTAQSLPMLDEIAVNMRANPSFKLTIAGHTDNTGTIDNSEKLSETRALACRGYLISKGIDADRIKTIGYGATRPKADNATLIGRELNNRIELSIGNY